MLRKILSAAAIVITFASCGSNEQKAEPTTPAKETETAMHPEHDSTATKADFSNVKFDSEKDFACGMPVSAGVSDTAHYKDKVYGFCSKECKEEFAKNPETYIAKK